MLLCVIPVIAGLSLALGRGGAGQAAVDGAVRTHQQAASRRLEIGTGRLRVCSSVAGILPPHSQVLCSSGLHWCRETQKPCCKCMANLRCKGVLGKRFVYVVGEWVIWICCMLRRCSAGVFQQGSGCSLGEGEGASNGPLVCAALRQVVFWQAPLAVAVGCRRNMNAVVQIVLSMLLAEVACILVNTQNTVIGGCNW